ncbi:uncharacterized protein LOC136081391 [Hydra vulgaris]|uniref:Uncharacterized protein LOC136081391 n=1 Tax=Hydra vulgaris TaxID=6087 RepID=A0ABM4BZS3_HYDVU
MGIKRTSMAKIIKKKLKLKPYKKNKSQLLSQAAKVKRKDRSLGLLHRFNGIDYRNILFTDEKIFTVESILNKQNDRVWAKSQPNVSVSRSSHPASVMVFAGITAHVKTPLIFVPQGIKVNGDNYLDMLK